MHDELGLGFINGHAVGRILKEAVRRACVAIRNERDTFEAQSKQHYSGTMEDVVTSADLKAQEIYARTFRECFPDCGVIAEERGLIIEPKNGCTAYFTVDPLDGTKAYVRRQSHGISTMVALVDCGRVIAAYIGDVNAEEVYGFRPDSDSVHRMTRLDTFERLNDVGAPKKGLFGAAALLREPIEDYAPETQALIKRFRTYEVMGSSIGTWAARLWKGEVGALLLNPGYQTPWDDTPVIGISRQLHFEYLRFENGSWAAYEPEPRTATTRREHDVLVVHRDCLKALQTL